MSPITLNPPNNGAGGRQEYLALPSARYLISQRQVYIEMGVSFSDLRAYMDEVPRKYNISGLDCILYRDHQEIFRYLSGYSDLEHKVPMLPDSLYNIYSATKIITCAAIMQLVESGRILLNNPLYEYLPEFREMVIQRGTFAFAPAKHPIKIVDLLSMSAGFTYNLNTPHVQKLIQDTAKDFSTREFVSALAKEPLLFEAGEGWNYSYSHDVLGAVIEVVSGLSFGDYLKQNVFNPLGMKNSYFRVPEEKRNLIAPQYQYSRKDNTIERITSDCLGAAGLRHESGGGGLISSTGDYILFADAMACGGVGHNGERILSSGTINLMKRNQLNGKQLRDFWRMGYSKGVGYGLGVSMVMDAAKAATLTPETGFSWGGIGGVQVYIDPESRFSLYVSQHTFGSPVDLFKSGMWNIIFSCI